MHVSPAAIESAFGCWIRHNANKTANVAATPIPELSHQPVTVRSCESRASLRVTSAVVTKQALEQCRRCDHAVDQSLSLSLSLSLSIVIAVAFTMLLAATSPSMVTPSPLERSLHFPRE